ncbi:hypothetical protein Bbelb_243850 [Branchiostoma belcheri]|nr:hypothetical protein Bbelb_243850 [Branchiostoma belcheri]
MSGQLACGVKRFEPCTNVASDRRVQLEPRTYGSGTGRRRAGLAGEGWRHAEGGGWLDPGQADLPCAIGQLPLRARLECLGIRDTRPLTPKDRYFDSLERVASSLEVKNLGLRVIRELQICKGQTSQSNKTNYVRDPYF